MRLYQEHKTYRVELPVIASYVVTFVFKHPSFREVSLDSHASAFFMHLFLIQGSFGHYTGKKQGVQTECYKFWMGSRIRTVLDWMIVEWLSANFGQVCTSACKGLISLFKLAFFPRSHFAVIFHGSFQFFSFLVFFLNGHHCFLKWKWFSSHVFLKI